MANRRSQLSADALLVLRLISDGHTYEQILQAHPGLTYLDIFKCVASRGKRALCSRDFAAADKGERQLIARDAGVQIGWKRTVAICTSSCSNR